MPSLTPNPHPLLWIFCLCMFANSTIAIEKDFELYCSPKKIPIENIGPNFLGLMGNLTKGMPKKKWLISTFDGTNNPKVYGLAQCMGNVGSKNCNQCILTAHLHLESCLPSESARIYLDNCFLRYDTYRFYMEAFIRGKDKLVCKKPKEGLKKYFRVEFTTKAEKVIRNVTATAAKSKGFAVAEVKGGTISTYALAQCWGTVIDQQCKMCLTRAAHRLRRCMPLQEGRALHTGCYVKYSLKIFYDDKPYKEGTSLQKVQHVVVIMGISLTLSLLSLFGACTAYKRSSEIRKERNLIRLTSNMEKSHLTFKYEALEKATDGFSDTRKLGQGGAGSVFKGILPDGKTVAVKKLFFNTRQWVDDFFNEVNLISGIKHKNLIKLLGCSIEGPESLLVYEYLPNPSLDQMVFGRNKIQILTWKQRYDIIVGTAEGLAYLHSGGQTRIIHRDIKCSNVLLDENLTARICDFGLVRRFAADKTHISTGIAGTLGYMAPEYLVRGQLTEKADIYSFGVLIIEVVCGRRNNIFMQETDSVLHAVWEHYQSDSLAEMVDSSLKEDFLATEASNVLRVGLLCTQTSAALRPSMCEVGQMLTDKDCTIHVPKQPPFMGTSALGNASLLINSGIQNPESDRQLESRQRTPSNGHSDHLQRQPSNEHSVQRCSKSLNRCSSQRSFKEEGSQEH